MFAGRRSQLAVSGQQLAVSNGRPTSHEPLATIFPPLLPNRGGPPDRFRRRRSESLFGPSGADQQEAQDGCQNGQLWLGVPLRESREMLFGENAIRRPQFAKPCLMDLLCISPFIRGGPPKAPFIGKLTAKGGLRG